MDALAKPSTRCGFSMNPNEVITVVISTSPLIGHPSTEIVDETYAQLRKHLPTAQVILLMDGVHPEQPHLAERYELFKEAIRQKTWENFTAIEFADWEHQSGTLQSMFQQELVKTPLIFWTEHDIPLRDDMAASWESLCRTLLEEDVAGIRFCCLRERKLSEERGAFTSQNGIALVRTVQFVGWPTLFRTEIFQEFVESFGPSHCYLEGTEYEGFFGNNY